MLVTMSWTLVYAINRCRQIGSVYSWLAWTSMADPGDGAAFFETEAVPADEPELNVEGESRGDAFTAPGFMTLVEASTVLDPNVFAAVRDHVWPNVVKVVVPIAPVDGARYIANGTGFSFNHKGHMRVMTNNHVIADHDVSQGSIRVVIGYDSPGTGTVAEVSVERTSVDPDMALLKFTGDEPSVLKNTLVEWTTGRLNAMFDGNFWRAVQGMVEQPLGSALIVGHPRGSFKRISMVKLVELNTEAEHNASTRGYTPVGSRPGNSGSPVIINANNAALSAAWVMCLHYASGKGVALANASGQL